MNFINIIMIETALLLNVEPTGSYPYVRKAHDCFETTNELHVDQTNNQMCLMLSRKNLEKCNIFNGGVYYDLFFDN